MTHGILERAASSNRAPLSEGRLTVDGRFLARDGQRVHRVRHDGQSLAQVVAREGVPQDVAERAHAGPRRFRTEHGLFDGVDPEVDGG